MGFSLLTYSEKLSSLNRLLKRWLVYGNCNNYRRHIQDPSFGNRHWLRGRYNKRYYSKTHSYSLSITYPTATISAVITITIINVVIVILIPILDWRLRPTFVSIPQLSYPIGLPHGIRYWLVIDHADLVVNVCI